MGIKILTEQDLEAVNEELKGKVDKNDGQGLSNVFDVLMDNGVVGDYSTPAGIQVYKYNPLNNNVEPSEYIEFYTKEQIDVKLANLPQGGGEATQIKIITGVNLNQVFEPGVYRVGSDCENIPDDIKTLDCPTITMYVTNDGGDGEYVDAHQILFAVDTVGVSYVFQRDVQKHLKAPYDIYAYPWGAVSGGGSADLSGYYTSEEVDALLLEKENAKENLIANVEQTTGAAVIELRYNAEYYVNKPIKLLTINADATYPNGQTWATFTTSDSLTVNADIDIKWLGDDCDAEGHFTPQPNTSYEVSFKQTAGGNIARVGVC